MFVVENDLASFIVAEWLFCCSFVENGLALFVDKNRLVPFVLQNDPASFVSKNGFVLFVYENGMLLFAGGSRKHR